MEAKDLKKLQEYQMIIMDEFVKFCNENNIEYFLLGGSTLGAVRHNGFIPWDDDMDVGLMRKDYELFLEKYVDNDKFYLQAIERDKNYWNMYAKLRMRNTLMEEERLKNLNLPKEIFIDIFPVDNVPSGGYNKIKIKANLVKILKMSLLVKYKVAKLYECNFKVITKICSWLPKGLIYKITKNIMMSHKDDNSEYTVMYLSEYAIKKGYFPRSIYFPTKDCKFENRVYKIPFDSDFYLKSTYGDYMTLPKEEDRISHGVVRVSFNTKENVND